MKSICLSCLLFTLKDKEVKDNLYLEIFYVWLAKVIQSGGLRQDDTIHLIIDKRTMNYLENTENALSIILDKLPCPLRVTTVEPPSTVLEGMMYRYNIIDYSQDIFIYCDIDILLSNSLHSLTDRLNDNTFYFCKEGHLYDENYSAGFSDTVKNKNCPGFSSGKFIITGKELYNSFFTTINTICDYSTDYYTKDQPFFNKAIYMIPLDTTSVDVNLLTEYVSFNGNDEYDKNKTIFNDMAGDVANGETHLKKIMTAISLYLIGFY